jgi:type I restriction enzyme M protein
VRGKYRDVILPMTVIRRLDSCLESTKQDVLKMSEQLDKAGVANKDAALCQAAGPDANHAFYNDSPFTLRDLQARAKQQQLKADFEAYLDGFSPNVQEILDKFKFRNQIPTLVDADALGPLIEKFLNPDINLSPHPVRDTDGNIRLPGLDNHAMGTIFEELIRRFNEENNEEGGIEAFFRREVLPHVPDAWIDASATKLGYEISFTRHFYKPPEMRPLEEIKADLLKLQEEGEGLLEEILGERQ